MVFKFRNIVEDYEARLQPVDTVRAGINANGKAERELFSNGEEEFDVRVRSLEVPDDSSLNVYLEQQFVGQIVVKNKRGRLRIESRNGITVPVVAAGNKITVMLDGAVLLDGLFAED